MSGRGKSGAGKPAEDGGQVRAGAELEELRQKIATLKQQRLLGILGVIGAVIAFLVSNSDKLNDLLFRKPRIQIVADDLFTLRNAVFTVVTAAESGAVVLSDSIPNPPKWFTIEPGTFRLTASIQGREIKRQDFAVTRGERRSLFIPGPGTSTIRVTATNMSGRIGPGTPLEFQVESSGNGYLWVLERRDSSVVLIYPTDCVDDCANAVTVGEGFHLPDAKRRSVFAGQHPGPEHLLFLITSRSDRETAQRLARQFETALITKAEGGQVTDNWGMTELSYDVEKP